MNKRRNIYRGFNRRKKNKYISIIIVCVCIGLAGGYGYKKIKESKIIENASNLVKSKFKNKEGFLDYNDYDLEGLNENNNNIEVPKEEDIKEEVSSEVKVAITNSWNIYTIQVASVESEADMKKMEDELIKNNLPFSVVDMEGVKKIHTYSSFDKDVCRTYLEEVKKTFPDAFISKMEMPTLSLEYTNKYEYIENISNNLNSLTENFKLESKFWDKKEEVDLKEYKEILTQRQKIVSDISKEAEKIDYSSMDGFKENLINYTENVSEKIAMASKYANEKNYMVSKSLYLASMHGYYEFIKTIQMA